MAGNTVAILGPAEDGSQKIGEASGAEPLIQADPRINIEPHSAPRGTTFQITLTDLEPRRVYTLEVWRNCSDEEQSCTERVTEIILNPTDRNGETRYQLRTFEEDIPGFYAVYFPDQSPDNPVTGKVRDFTLSS